MPKIGDYVKFNASVGVVWRKRPHNKMSVAFHSGGENPIAHFDILERELELSDEASASQQMIDWRAKKFGK